MAYLGTPGVEKGVDVAQLALGREAGGADLDDGAEHGEAGRQFLLEHGPVGLHPAPEGVDAGGVGAEGGDGEVEVLALDVVAEGQGEGALDEGRVGGAAEGAQGRVALVGVARGAVYLEDGVVLCGRVWLVWCLVGKGEGDTSVLPPSCKTMP